MFAVFTLSGSRRRCVLHFEDNIHERDPCRSQLMFTVDTQCHKTCHATSQNMFMTITKWHKLTISYDISCDITKIHVRQYK